MKPDVHYAWNRDVALAYQTVGEGRTDLLLVMGYVSNIEYMWEYPSLAAFLHHLARGRRLIVMDRRGSGLSDPFPTSEAPPLETLVEDIHAVLNAAGSPRTTLLGIFDGCLMATMFAATYPRQVSSLILFSANPLGRLEDDAPWGWTDDVWEEWLRSIREGWGTRAWVVTNARWQSPSVLDDPEELEHLITFNRLSASPSSAAAVLRLEWQTDIRQVLPTVRVPTLVLNRVDDRAQPIEGARYMAQQIPGATLIELPGDDALPWLGDRAGVLDEIDAFLGTRGDGQPEGDRRLSTVLFTDIVGSTEHLSTIGDAGWRDLLGQHDKLARQAIERTGGHYVGTTGDGLLATFEGPASAVRCAQEIGAAIRPLGLEIRSGVHTGELELVGSEVRGIAVHIGARVMSLAGPSEVMVSSTVKDLSPGSGLVFEDAGEHELKGVPDRWALYRVVG
jgi:class 3 adenylate cyclase/alpha-beta hydrolase superfamily lysophospholipase